MKPIDLAIWEPNLEDPRYMRYVGQPVAEEVFRELEKRLKESGFLPDEYFLMDMNWENGRKIPKGAELFCTADYGGSEGVYVDVHLKWYEKDKSVIRSFATGKTLGEMGYDMDRMFLTASAITYVWRCLNRMENGKRICKNSPTFREEALHTAIVAAMNEMFSQQAARDVLRESVATALASTQPKMSLPAIENRMRELKARQDELVTLVSCGDATFEAVETEFSKIGEEWNDLKLLHTKLELEQPSTSEIDRRMEQITSTIDQMDAAITAYDDIRTRQLISTIKVLDKETLLIRFKDRTEITQHIEK